MPPRATRSNAASATPSRARRGASPTASSLRSSDVWLDSVRSPLISKHSISYGSPLAQLPDRASTVGDARVSSVAARVFKQVKKDNQSLASRSDTTGADGAPPSTRASLEDEVELVHHPDDAAAGQNGGGEDADEVMGEAGEEAEEAGQEAHPSQPETRGKRTRRRNQGLEEEGPVEEHVPARRPGGATSRQEGVKAATQAAKQASDMEIAKKEAIAASKAAREAAEAEAQKAARKRRRDDEAQAEEDLERVERESRQRRERLAEAQRQAEERRIRQQESAQKSPAQPSIPATGTTAGGTRRPPGTPFGASRGNIQPPPPDTARSWREEGNVYGATNLSSSPLDGGDAPDKRRKTPPRSSLRNIYQESSDPVMSGARNPQLPPILEPPELLSQRRGAGRVIPGVPRVPEFQLNRPTPPADGTLPHPENGLGLRRPLASLPGVGNQARNQPDWRHGGSLGSRHQDDDRTGARPGKENGDPDDSGNNQPDTTSNNRQDLNGSHSPGDDAPSDSSHDSSADGGRSDRSSSVEDLTQEGTAHDEPRWLGFKRIPSLWTILKFIAIALMVFPILQALRSAMLVPAPILTDEQFDRLNEFLRDPSALTPGAREELKALLPRMIHVQRDRAGKLVIDNEFWHAIKARVQEDESILTLNDQSKLSERHWKALKDQFPVGAASPVVQSWETWLKQNEKKVINLVGTHFDRIVEEKLPSNVVSSEEFLRELQAGLSKQKREMAGDLGDIKSSITSVIEDFTKLKSSKGMPESEVSKLVDKMVKQAIGKAQLKHAAKNNIGSSTDPELQNRINHFAFGNGAALDVALTSPTFRVGRPRVGAGAWLANAKKAPQFIREGHAALTPWEDAGQCWCAGIIGVDNQTFPADVGVMTANLIIPEFVVLEHINPAETNDPEAMPKEVEVWAKIIEPQREKVIDWAVASFPRTYTEPDRHDLKSHEVGFIKLAEFTYTYEASTNGVFVKKLSDELIKPLQAATDLIIVRARTNYGADHTCFYRIRMYGQNYDILEFMQKPSQSEPQVFMDDRQDKPWYRVW
ncbi:hypothetical protein QBC34DRAFT_402539 [Podospora aff. communis PSN243]|uniref:SUN domain-containing protein n=1 Tax=Podospora aff. communis PSN243 TaxID=3040156 RepID=A0AAV9GRC5_9PEZI|nr:hypothetical protein QBC34DRAFT_402539 [Podospora aff. communis PSN243]